MNLFDKLVDTALRNKRDLVPLRIVIEKELLHRDILQVLSKAGLLSQLTFIGGTCLRACYGSNRLSEDLDFTGGTDFTRIQLSGMQNVLVESLKAKYGLEINVTDPVREEGNVDTWKIKVQTRPKRKDIPAQRINIDVCAIPSYQVQPLFLLDHYGVDTGNSGLILNAQSREEIFADKLIAFALRPNKLKNRDLWDIAWLHQQQIKPAIELIEKKLTDHRVTSSAYLKLFSERSASLFEDPQVAKAFLNEMGRFLPRPIVMETVNSKDFWLYLTGLFKDYRQLMAHTLESSKSQRILYKM